MVLTFHRDQQVVALISEEDTFSEVSLGLHDGVFE
jgi:hypothetical protein